MACIDDVTICVTRGDAFALDVGLSSAFSEVEADPTSYLGRLVFREDQDDQLPVLLELTAIPEVSAQPLVGEDPTYLHFEATGGQTQSLPDWTKVAYCEIEGIHVPGNPGPMRLFNGEVDLHD